MPPIALGRVVRMLEAVGWWLLEQGTRDRQLVFRKVTGALEVDGGETLQHPDVVTTERHTQKRPDGRSYGPCILPQYNKIGEKLPVASGA